MRIDGAGWGTVLVGAAVVALTALGAGCSGGAQRSALKATTTAPTSVPITAPATTSEPVTTTVPTTTVPATTSTTVRAVVITSPSTLARTTVTIAAPPVATTAPHPSEPSFSPSPPAPPQPPSYAGVVAYDVIRASTASACTRSVTWSYRLLANGQGGPGQTAATSNPQTGQAEPVMGGTGYTCQYTGEESDLEGGLWQISNTLGHSCQMTLQASTSIYFTNVSFTSPTTCS